MAGSHHSSGHHSGSHHSSHSSSHHSSHSSHSSHHSHHYHSSSGHSSYSSRYSRVSPFSDIKRDTYVDFEEYKSTHEGMFEQTGEKDGLTNEVSVMPMTGDYVSKMSQESIEYRNNQEDSTDGVIIHSTMKKDHSGTKIKIDSPKAPYRDVGIDEALIYGRSWVIGDAYALDACDNYFIKNYKGGSFMANPEVKMIVTIVVAFILFGAGVSNAIYELLIPIFENMDMTNDAFYAIDDLIYYGQFTLFVIAGLIGFISTKRLHKKNRMFTAQMIKEHLVNEEKQRYEYTHEFLPICPQCGAARQSTEVSCIYCGASLIRSTNQQG